MLDPTNANICPKCRKKQLPKFDSSSTAVACQECGHVVEMEMDTNDHDIDVPVEGLNALGQSIYNWADKKGWNKYLDDSPDCIGKQIANMHSEITEAWLEIVDNNRVDEIYWSDGKEGGNGNPVTATRTTTNTKPEGFVIELADCIIRILHTCNFHGLDIERAVYLKMMYNHTRPYRHGGKAA